MDILLHSRKNGPQRFHLASKPFICPICHSCPFSGHVPLPLPVPTITFINWCMKTWAGAHRKYSTLSWKAQTPQAFICKADCLVSFGTTLRSRACSQRLRLLPTSSQWPLLAWFLSILLFLALRSLCIFAQVAVCPHRSSCILRLNSNIEGKHCLVTGEETSCKQMEIPVGGSFPSDLAISLVLHSG